MIFQGYLYFRIDGIILQLEMNTSATQGLAYAPDLYVEAN
jgi:hypothetical protein